MLFPHPHDDDVSVYYKVHPCSPSAPEGRLLRVGFSSSSVHFEPFFDIVLLDFELSLTSDLGSNPPPSTFTG